MATEIVSAIPFDESGDDIHVITTTSSDFTADSLAFGDNGVTLKRDGIDVNFLPYSSIYRIYQEL